MKKLKSPASQSEAMKLRWKKRIVFEKDTPSRAPNDGRTT